MRSYSRNARRNWGRETVREDEEEISKGRRNGGGEGRGGR